MYKRELLGLGLLAAATIVGTTAIGQTPKPKEVSDVIFSGERVIVGPQGPEGPLMPPLMPPPETGVIGQSDHTFVFLSSEFSFDNHVVKNAPYFAQAITETVQTLADGNRIVRKNTASIYRDGQGRTRREQSFGAIGPYVATGDLPETISINDPVNQVNYILEPKTKTARKISFKAPGGGGQIGTFQIAVPKPGSGPGGLQVGGSPERGFRYEVHGEAGGPMSAQRMKFREPKTESLGNQTIEGIEAEGTRTTVTIPAGEIGNEREINIITERWYSPELQVVVLNKRNDPLTGEVTYKLTNINRDEPASSLFDVPGDYKVMEGPGFREFRVKQKENSPKSSN
jgi:hypothetical protein